jgi:hypothetical protein
MSIRGFACALMRISNRSGGIVREARRPLLHKSNIGLFRPRPRRPRNRIADRGVGEAMPTSTLRHAAKVSALAAVSVVLVACASGAASSSPAATPGTSAAPSAPPTPTGIDHPIGATDVVLRIEQGGGFVPMEFQASQAPAFTLYGDGRIVFQQRVDVFPEPDAKGVTHYRAWRTAQLDADQVEELLTFALGAGGLGIARESYVANGIADAPDTTFTIDAGGVKKTVVVNALGMDTPDSPDAAARKSFQALAERLQDFDRGGTIESDVFVPERYRGVLNERDPDPSLNPLPWPWPSLKPTDFTSSTDNGSGGIFMGRHALSVADVTALGLGDVGGGAQGVVLTGPDQKLYTLILRPLLPDETS